MSRIALCLGLAAALFFSCPWRAAGEERGGAGEWEEKTRQEDNGGEEELSALEGHGAGLFFCGRAAWQP